VAWIKARAANVIPGDRLGVSHAVSTHGVRAILRDARTSKRRTPGTVTKLRDAPNSCGTPRIADCELMLGGLSVLLGTANVAGLDSVVAKPGDASYADKARYADPYWALLESGG
jgi:hypothetical protein